MRRTSTAGSRPTNRRTSPRIRRRTDACGSPRAKRIACTASSTSAPRCPCADPPGRCRPSMARHALLLALVVAVSASGAGGANGEGELTFYPQAGVPWQDLYPNNFVDLDPGPGVRDYGVSRTASTTGGSARRCRSSTTTSSSSTGRAGSRSTVTSARGSSCDGTTEWSPASRSAGPRRAATRAGRTCTSRPRSAARSTSRSPAS